MRIGIDARLWEETGVGRYIRNLVWQLKELDNKNDYILFVKKGIANQELQITNQRWKVVETDIHWHTLEEQMLFHKVLENEYLDLVHFPYFSIPILYNKPFVITIHDLIINHFPTGKASQLPFPLYHIKRQGYKFIIKQAAKKAEKILTVSETTKKEIIDHLKVSDNKIVVTYEGIDSSLREVNTRQSHKESLSNGLPRAFVAHNDGERYFLYVGNAYPHKNIERLVEAFKLLHDMDSRLRGNDKIVKLVLVGAKNYFYEKIEANVKKMGLDDSVIFIGKVSDEELVNLYKHAEALIFPSLMEGFGLPGLEAMQHGTIVLASDIPIFREIYQNAAVYFDPKNTDAITHVMNEVLKDKKKFAKQQAEGKILVHKYSWETLAKETLAVYTTAVHN